MTYQEYCAFVAQQMWMRRRLSVHTVDDRLAEMQAMDDFNAGRWSLVENPVYGFTYSQLYHEAERGLQ